MFTWIYHFVMGTGKLIVKVRKCLFVVSIGYLNLPFLLYSDHVIRTKCYAILSNRIDALIFDLISPSFDCHS